MLVNESLNRRTEDPIPAQRKETIFVSALLALDSDRMVFTGTTDQRRKSSSR